MKAVLRPYGSKYYGTEIDIYDDGDDVGKITIYTRETDGFVPSPRELVESGFEDVGEWFEEDRKYGLELSHAESNRAYDIAMKLIGVINNA